MNKNKLQLFIVGVFVALGSATAVYAGGNTGLALPETTAGTSVNPSWFGYDATTIAFSAALTTSVPTIKLSQAGRLAQGAVTSVTFSTGNCGDFLDLYDSTANYIAGAQSYIFARVYNVANSTGGSVGRSPSSQTCWGDVPVNKKYYRGLQVLPNAATYNLITVNEGAFPQ